MAGGNGVWPDTEIGLTGEGTLKQDSQKEAATAKALTTAGISPAPKEIFSSSRINKLASQHLQPVPCPTQLSLLWPCAVGWMGASRLRGPNTQAPLAQISFH